MKKDKKLLFTTGELAALSKISRKTLLFYDKLGLLKPAYTDINGYRYYARNQFLSLEIILTMRKLDISLADIKTYLNNKSSASYLDFLVKQEARLTELLLNIVKTKNELYNSVILFDQLNKTNYETVSILKEKEEPLYLSEKIPQDSTSKIKTEIFAEHFSSTRNFMTISNNTFGYILDKKILLNNERPRVKYFFRPINDSPSIDNHFIKQAGTYAVLYFNGPYSSKKIMTLLPIIAKYISNNNLTISSDLYITSVKNYWLTDDEDSYINKIAIKIAKNK
jgi:DNA-binding transcriptional MerR regulator